MVERYADKVPGMAQPARPKGRQYVSRMYFTRIFNFPPTKQPIQERCNRHANWSKRIVMCTENARTRIF